MPTFSDHDVIRDTAQATGFACCDDHGILYIDERPLAALGDDALEHFYHLAAEAAEHMSVIHFALDGGSTTSGRYYVWHDGEAFRTKDADIHPSRCRVETGDANRAETFLVDFLDYKTNEQREAA